MVECMLYATLVIPQVSIARNSPLVGASPAEARFRTKCGAAIIAIHRQASDSLLRLMMCQFDCMVIVTV